MIKKSTAIRAGMALVVIAAGGWFFYTSWVYQGPTWLYEPPNRVHFDDERYTISRDSPVTSLGTDNCRRFDSMPIIRKPLYWCHGERPTYLVIEWSSDEFYQYDHSGPARFWDQSGW